MSLVLLILACVYVFGGLLFAVAFVVEGAKRIDPRAAHGSWGFRLSILPGSLAFWPLLLGRWLKGIREPPEEDNAHRRATKGAAQ